jgi:hypothetical protein
MFDWADFTTLLDPSVIAMTVCIGLAFGLVVVNTHRRGGVLFYWMVASGLAFLIPLTILRHLQGSEIWERWLSALVLWLIYSGSAYAGDRLARLLFTRKP